MGNCLGSSARVDNRENTFGGKNQNPTYDIYLILGFFNSLCQDGSGICIKLIQMK